MTGHKVAEALQHIPVVMWQHEGHQRHTRPSFLQVSSLPSFISHCRFNPFKGIAVTYTTRHLHHTAFVLGTYKLDPSGLPATDTRLMQYL